MTRSDPEPFPMLPAHAVLEARLTAALPEFASVRWVPETGSTNADLIAQARGTTAPLMRPWLLGAHKQTEGRGRAGRSWQNEAGQTLMFSCAFDVFLPAAQLAGLSPLLGATACEALRQAIDPGHRLRLNMKWPNDLRLDQGKLAGILIESTRAGTTLAPDHYLIVIGIGLNVHGARRLTSTLSRDIADWQTLVDQGGVQPGIDGAELIVRLARAWYATLNTVTASRLADLPERYAQVDGLLGQVVDIFDDTQWRQSGIACGVDAHGRLLLRTSTGQKALSVGEISVRAPA